MSDSKQPEEEVRLLMALGLPDDNERIVVNNMTLPFTPKSTAEEIVVNMYTQLSEKDEKFNKALLEARRTTDEKSRLTKKNLRQATAKIKTMEKQLQQSAARASWLQSLVVAYIVWVQITWVLLAAVRIVALTQPIRTWVVGVILGSFVVDFIGVAFIVCDVRNGYVLIKDWLFVCCDGWRSPVYT
jgi:hypothetical protein